MKILFLSHSSFAGGAERCLCMLLSGLPRDKYEPLVVLPPKGLLRRRGKGDISPTVEQMGIETVQASVKWWVGDWTRYKPFARGLEQRVEDIARIIKREEVELVVSNTCVVVEGALAASRCRVPHVWYVHEMLDRDPVLDTFLPPERFYSLLSGLSAKVVAVSESVKSEVEQFGPLPNVEVLYTGIPPLEPSGLEHPKQELFGHGDDTPVVSFVGLLSRRKGVLDLIDAAALVHADLPKARFVLAGGDGGEAREAARRIDSLGINDAVQLLGPRSDVPDILAATDVFVLPALADPLPLVVLEAMSMGLPVVATHSGGCAEMVVDNQTGRLVPVGDAKSLAAAISQLLSDPSMAKEMGRRGKQRFDSLFSRQRYIDQFGRIFDEAAQTEPAEVLPALEDELQATALSEAARHRRTAPVKQRLVEMLRSMSLVR